MKTIGELYELQKQLDARIIKEKGLEGQDLLPNTILALQVEICELANEWRGFKFWSKDQKPRTEENIIDQTAAGNQIFNIVVGKRNPLLEEYVDCLHFFLSIARQLDVPVEKLEHTDSSTVEMGIIAVFSGLLSSVGMIRVYEPAFYHSWNEFIALGECLGFTWDEIVAAYVAKNKINHERQSYGY